MGPIAKRLIKAVRKAAKQRVVDLEAYRVGKQEAEHLEDKVRAIEKVPGTNPAFAYFVYCQNRLSNFVELVTGLPEMSRFADVVEQADDTYQPLGPPMSPLTNSYFSSWAYYDLVVGSKKETLASCMIELGRAMKLHPNLLEGWRALERSRLGFYCCEQAEGDIATLRELVTGQRHRCLVGSGYEGKPGEIWLVRLMETPSRLFEGYVTTITPYIHIKGSGERWNKSSEQDWQPFMVRNLGANPEQRIEKYVSLMKFGRNRHYWNEYIFEAYVNHTSDMIYLAGFPDIEESRPHSRANWD